MGTPILIIEDDPVVRELVTSALERDGMETTAVETGEAGLKFLAENPAALVLLDVNLPGTDGWEILKSLRASPHSHQPSVIMLSVRREEQDRIQGLDMGADDYICKPFSARELTATVRAVLRRTNLSPGDRDEIRVAGLHIDITGRAVWRADQRVHLTPKEFDILVMLAGKPNEVFPRSELYNAVWGESGQGDEHTLEVHIDRLRHKLAGPDGETYVKTIKGKGYKLQAPSEE